MKTYEIDFSAPVAVLKSNPCSPFVDAKVYKVKRYAAFVIMLRNCSDKMLGDVEQTINYAKNHGFHLIPKNNRGRKFFERF